MSQTLCSVCSPSFKITTHEIRILKIPGIPWHPQFADNNSFIHYYRAGLCAHSKSPMPCIMPLVFPFAPAPTHQTSQPNVLWTALSVDEEAAQGWGQWQHSCPPWPLQKIAPIYFLTARLMKPYRSFSVGPPKAWRRQNSLTSTIHYCGSTEHRKSTHSTDKPAPCE